MAYDFDFAISFAGEKRDLARELTTKLEQIGYSVFFDENYEHELLGADGIEYFSNIFLYRSRYCVALISKSYDAKEWTRLEKEIILSRGLKDKSNYLLPIIVENYSPPWLLPSRIYFNLEKRSISSLISVLSRSAGKPGQQIRVIPSIVWRQKIGIGTWKSECIFNGDTIIVPTAGDIWNKPDRGDGIYCLTKRNGSIVWHTHTDGDCNSILFHDEHLYAGTDSGSLYCINADNGYIKWRTNLDGRILSKPIANPKCLYCCTTNSVLYALDIDDGHTVGVYNLDGGVVADPIQLPPFTYIVTTNGCLYEFKDEVLTFEANTKLRSNRKKRFLYPEKFSDTWAGAEDKQGLCEFHASPIIWGHMLILPYVRETYFNTLPIAAIDMRNLKDIWIEATHDSSHKHLGNIRCRPCICNDVLITAAAYGNWIAGIDKHGKIIWLKEYGRPFFPHWGSPVSSNGSVFVPRYDGFIHCISPHNGLRQWSIYLGSEDFVGKIFEEREELPGQDIYPEWENQSSASLNAPLTIDNNIIYTPGSDGFITALKIA